MTMYFLYLLFIFEILASSPVDSAERKTTYIKSQAEKLSKIAQDFHTNPNAPILFYNHQMLREATLELKKELLKIHDSN